MLVIRYCENSDMLTFINKNQKSNIKWKYVDLLYILKQISKGLFNIHKHNLCHQDLHSGNILFSTTRYCYIGDLGLCKSANLRSDNQQQIVGVLPYIAP